MEKTKRSVPKHFGKLLIGALLLNVMIFVLDYPQYGLIYPAWYNISPLLLASSFLVIALWHLKKGNNRLSTLFALSNAAIMPITSVLLIDNSLLVNIAVIIFIALFYMAIIDSKEGKIYLVTIITIMMTIGLMQDYGLLFTPKINFETTTIIPVLAVLLALLGAFLSHQIQRSKKLVENLKSTQDQLSSIFQHSPVATIIQKCQIDEFNQENLNVNPAFLKLFNYGSIDEVYALPKTNPEQFARIFTYPQLDEPIAAGENKFNFISTVDRENGTQFKCSVQQYLERDSNGNPYRFVVQWVDITDEMRQKELLENRVEERTADLQKANNALEVASARKDSFLAMMSHELRTPLNTILARTQALQWGVYGKLEHKQIESVSGIEKSGTHLLNLIQGILDVSKIAAGDTNVDFKDVDLTKICTESINDARLLATQKSQSISLNFQHTQNTIIADEIKLKQIIDNLLSNAIKFTPDGKRVGLIIAESGSDEIQLIVWDEGIGIDKEEQSLLFEPFMQLDSRLSRDFEGTGLGLVVVKQFAELHGGSVAIKSEPNEGSKFIVTLPYNPITSAQESVPNKVLVSS